MLNSIITLLKYNINVEYRRYAQLGGVVLFSWIVCYLIYRVHPGMDVMEFGYVYWIFLMILCVNICLRIESHHGSAEHLFLYQHSEPNNVLVAKIVFNAMYIFILGFLFYIFFIIYFSSAIIFHLEFLLVLIVGSISLSASMSFVSAINSYAGGQNTLLSILALPLLIPVILILKSLTDEIFLNENIEYLKYLTLISISFITGALSLILFPFVWKE